MSGGLFPGIGVLKSSPDGTRLLGCYTAGLEVYDFDKTTGIVSNPVLLDSAHLNSFGYYGGDFSPDGTKIYAKEYINYDLWQYDLNAGNPAASGMVVGTVYPSLRDIRLAPDQKLYFTAKAGYPIPRYMGRINMPNNAGAACGFQDSIISLAFDTAHVPKGNLGNVIMFPVFNLPLVISFSNNILSTTNSFSSYQWYKAGIIINGAINQTCPTTGAGWYSVKVSNTNGCIDSAAYEVTSGTDITDLQKLKNSIYIYPNPAQDKVWIESPVVVQAALINTESRVVTTSLNGTTLNIEHISDGMYFLRISDKEGNLIKMEKLVIRHHE
jgi:hypothetical protein